MNVIKNFVNHQLEKKLIKILINAASTFKCVVPTSTDFIRKEKKNVEEHYDNIQSVLTHALTHSLLPASAPSKLWLALLTTIL